MLLRTIGILALTLAASAASADTIATTEDGRKVILRDNGTWAFVEQAQTAEEQPRATLTLENRVDLARGCRLGLRLKNDLSSQIRSLVLRFTAYKGDEIAFETVSRGFSYIKPTASQYQEISFRGIRCGEISSVGVSAARNCHVGELTKYSASEQHCLQLIDVADSQVLPIAKEQSAE